MVKVILNLQDLALETVREGNRFEACVAKAFAVQLGLFGVGATLYEVPPGKIACPFHRHHTSDEMLFILSGAGTYRYGEQCLAVHAGDCLGAPAGVPEGDLHAVRGQAAHRMRAVHDLPAGA